MIAPIGLLISLCAQSAPADFHKDILPLFAKRCQGCHGQQQQMAGLRLDRADASQARSASKLVERVSSDKKGYRMPPVGEPLTVTEVAAIRSWVERGAVWPTGAVATGKGTSHWAFQPPRRQDGASIDSFLLAKLKVEGVEPSPVADPRTLIRRVTLDLTGLPPTPWRV